MKKIIPFVIIVLIVVIGVIFFLVLNKSKDSSELEESIGKAQLVEVYDYDTNELLKTYENKEDIESLINNLGLDKWKLDKEPNDDTKKYFIGFPQQTTIPHYRQIYLDYSLLVSLLKENNISIEVLKNDHQPARIPSYYRDDSLTTFVLSKQKEKIDDQQVPVLKKIIEPKTNA